MNFCNSAKHSCLSARKLRRWRSDLFSSRTSSRVSSLVMFALPNALFTYRKGQTLQKRIGTAIYCSVMIPTLSVGAHTSDSDPSTARDQRLSELLESSGQANDELLLSEQFRRNSALRRQYLETISKPDWLSVLSLNSHFESFENRDTRFSLSIGTESVIQFESNFEAEARWSILYTPDRMRILPDSPSFAPFLENLTLSYGKMRSVELSAGLLNEESLLISNPISGQFSGLSAAIHPLKDKTQPQSTHFSFQVEHGWSAPLPSQGEAQNIQRTRPSLKATKKNQHISLEGRTALEWYTDPDLTIHLLSSSRSNQLAQLAQRSEKKWRLFILESSVELTALRNTRLKVSASRINNSLVPKQSAGWSSSFLIAQDYHFSKAQSSFELKTTLFNTPKESIPHFRLPFELSPASRGMLSAFAVSILPNSLKGHELQIRLNFLRETLPPESTQSLNCQPININGNISCGFFFGEFSLIRTLGPNL